MANSVLASFASLVRYNNGFFKSDRQAAFLRSFLNADQKVEDLYETRTISQRITYTCDDRGIISVEKHNLAAPRAKSRVTWERTEAGKVTAQDVAEIKRIQRLLRDFTERLDSRDAAYASGEYTAGEALYRASRETNLADIDAVKQKLRVFGL